MKKKQKKTDKREYILMIVPYHGQEVRSFRIPIIAVKYTCAILSLLVVIVAGLCVDYRHTLTVASAQIDELENLRQNNSNQVKQIEELAKTTTSLQVDMERLNSLDAEIRHILNNEDVTTTSRSGLVRPSVNYKVQDRPQIQSDINNMNQITNHLQVEMKVREESLVELKQELLDKRLKQEVTPSIWPATGEVTSRFGWRGSPFGSSSDYHPGLDIANATGTPIVATAAGEVAQSEWYGGYGNMVRISHGNGIDTIYGHCLQNLVEAGQTVKKGEIIAYMGNTGYSTGAHVHYEVRVNGTAVNPTSFLK